MTIQKRIYNNGELLVCHLSETVEGDDLIALLLWIMERFEEKALKANYRVLLDLKEVDNIEMDEADVYRISQVNVTYRQERGRVKTAIVVSSESGKHLAELHKLLSAAVDIVVEIFESEQDAYDWLGVELKENVTNHA